MYDIFGKYGPIRQIRTWVFVVIRRIWIRIIILSACFTSDLLFRGNTPETRGTAYVVYEDIFDAKNACDHLSGFNVCNRYLVVLYYNANRVSLTGITVVHFIAAVKEGRDVFDIKPQCVVCLYLCNYLSLSFVNFAGFPKDGHKEKGGAVKTSKREIWNQHGPSKVAFWWPFFIFMSRILHLSPLICKHCKITIWTAVLWMSEVIFQNSSFCLILFLRTKCVFILCNIQNPKQFFFFFFHNFILKPIIHLLWNPGEQFL